MSEESTPTPTAKTGAERQMMRLTVKAADNEAFYKGAKAYNTTRQSLRQFIRIQKTKDKRSITAKAFQEAKANLKVRKSLRLHPERAWAAAAQQLGWSSPGQA